MAIESGARKMNISGSDMHRRLKQQGLIHRRLFRHYDELHTQSLDRVANDIAETLMNWEKDYPIILRLKYTEKTTVHNFVDHKVVYRSHNVSKRIRCRRVII